MADLPYAIIVSGESVMEVNLANHAGGSNLTQTVKVVSNTVDKDGKRTVVMTRAMTGASAQYYSFDPVK